MKKAVKFLPATAAVAAVAVMTTTTTTTTTTNNNVVVDAFSVHPATTTHHPTTTSATTTNTSRKAMTVSKTMNGRGHGHGPFCTCYGCTTSSRTFGGCATMKLKLSSSSDDDDRTSIVGHLSSCDCPACSRSGSSIGISEQQPTTFFEQKGRSFGITQHGSLCDCDFCLQQRQQQQQRRNRHGLGCSCCQCMQY